MKNHGNKLGVISAIALVAALPGRKLTKEFLESEIDKVEYNRFGETNTHCTNTTKSGFSFTGESACVDPNNFDQKIGEKFAYENAFNKMWTPYGFWLHKALTEIDYQSKLNEAQALIDSHSKRETTESGSVLPETERLSFDDEPYQIKDTDQFTLELAIALAQNGDVVRNVNTGTTLSLDDCRHDAFWQLAQAPKAESWLDRLQTEHDELAIKVKKLKAFIESDAFNSISPVQATMLEEQLEHMGNYLALLDERIANANDPSFARD